MMDQQSNDLNQLVYSAQKATSHRAPIEKQPRPIGIERKTVATATLLLAVLVWGWYFYSNHIGDKQVSEDLGAILVRAKSSIDQEFAQQGKLPAVIPDPHTAALVQYEVTNANARPPAYQLSAEIHGIRRSIRSE